jgi:hypothetical protein
MKTLFYEIDLLKIFASFLFQYTVPILDLLAASPSGMTPADVAMNAAAMTETGSTTAADNAATAPHDGGLTVAVTGNPTGTGLIMAPTGATTATTTSASAVKGTTTTTLAFIDPIGLSTKKVNKINNEKYIVNAENKATTALNHLTLEVEEEGGGTISER